MRALLRSDCRQCRPAAGSQQAATPPLLARVAPLDCGHGKQARPATTLQAVKSLDVTNYDDLKPRGKPEQKVLREADNRGSVEGARSWRDLAQLSAEWLTGEQHPGSKMANLAVDIMLRLAQVADFRRIPPAEKPAFIKLVEDLTAVLTMNITSLRAAVLPGLLSSYAALGYPNRKAAQALLEAMAVGIADSDGRSRLSGDNLFAALAAAAALGYRPAPGTVRIIVNASHKDLRYLSDRGVADAAFALSRLQDEPYQGGWLDDFARAATNSLPNLDGPALGHLGYMLARARSISRHVSMRQTVSRWDDEADEDFDFVSTSAGGSGGGGNYWEDGGASSSGGDEGSAKMVVRSYRPTPQFCESYTAALHTSYASKLRSLTAADAARVMFALRRWNHRPSDSWTDTFLTAIGQRPVLGAMSGAQLAAVAGALAALYPGSLASAAGGVGAAGGAVSDALAAAGGRSGAVPSAARRRFVSELCFAARDKAAETKPADAVALLAALARLGARPSGAWVDEALAVVEPGLPDLSPAQFVALVGSLDALRHEPDEIWVASAFGALAHSAKKADAEALQTLKECGEALAVLCGALAPGVQQALNKLRQARAPAAAAAK